MPTQKELFETKYKAEYLKAYRFFNGDEKVNSLTIEYKNGFVYISSDILSKPTKVRVYRLINMIDVLNMMGKAKKEKEEEIKNTITEEELKTSEEFKTWIDEDTVDLIHNIYSKSSPTFIVIHKGSFDVTYTVTRFFKMDGKIQVSVDYRNINAHNLFVVLLTKYSRELA